MAARQLSPDGLRAQIASGGLDPVYLIHGEDEAEKTSLAAAFASAVEEDVRAFNVERLYASEPSTTITGILDSARTLPWLASRRVILVLQAEQLLMPRRDSDAADRELERLGDYI